MTTVEQNFFHNSKLTKNEALSSRKNLPSTLRIEIMNNNELYSRRDCRIILGNFMKLSRSSTSETQRSNDSDTQDDQTATDSTLAPLSFHLTRQLPINAPITRNLLDIYCLQQEQAVLLQKRNYVCVRLMSKNTSFYLLNISCRQQFLMSNSLTLAACRLQKMNGVCIP